MSEPQEMFVGGRVSDLPITDGEDEPVPRVAAERAVLPEPPRLGDLLADERVGLEQVLDGEEAVVDALAASPASRP